MASTTLSHVIPVVTQGWIDSLTIPTRKMLTMTPFNMPIINNMIHWKIQTPHPLRKINTAITRKMAVQHQMGQLQHNQFHWPRWLQTCSFICHKPEYQSKMESCGIWLCWHKCCSYWGWFCQSFTELTKCHLGWIWWWPLQEIHSNWSFRNCHWFA